MTSRSTARFASLALGLALSASGIACRPATRDTPKPDVAAVAKDHAFRNDKGQLVCPVMGDVIESEAAAVAKTSYAGKEYYFCCKSCVRAFEKEPDKYADGRHLKEKAGGSCGDTPTSGDPSSGTCK